MLFGFLQHQKTPKTNSCTNLHLVFFFCCCCCFTAEEVQLDQKKLFFKGGEISNSLDPFLFCFCLPATAAHGDRRRNWELGACMCRLCWGLDRRRIWKLCVCVCVCWCWDLPPAAAAANNHQQRQQEKEELFPK